MPIRFACPQCGRNLSVGSQQAGRKAVCPKCQTQLQIPRADELTLPADEPSESAAANEEILEAPPVAISETTSPVVIDLASFDSEPRIEVVYERASASIRRSNAKRGEATIDFDTVAVPRYILFTQGILLAVVGIVCFLLGMAVGGAVTEQGSTALPAATPLIVSGEATTSAQKARSPDAGAVVIFLPAAAKPEERTPLFGLRPGDDPTSGERARQKLNLIGARVARCDGKGHYSVDLPDRGRYFMLALSANAQAKKTTFAPQEIAQIARFFDLSDQPLDDFRATWRNEAITSSRTINVDFD